MPLSLQQLAAFSSELVNQPTPVKVLVTFVILLGGYITARILGTIAESIYRRLAPDGIVEQVKNREREPAKIVEYLISVVTIGVALLYLDSTATSRLMTEIINYIPSVMTAALVLIGGLIVVKLFMNFLINFIDTVGFKKYIRDLGFSAKLVEGFFKGLKLFLYLVVFEVAIIQLGVSSMIVSNTITAASYGFVIVVGLLAFFGFKDLVANYAAGLYLRGSDVLKPGKKVKIDDESGEIRQISALGTTITTDTGY
ncbi:MAG: hypothetical protein SVU32_05065, partial [Candidatus Nanohaloarchaea archaeon]|nr:hypothetical protein [Candidatus Nanohaloarchaea archaeon]